MLVSPLEAAQTVTLANGDYAVVDPEYDLPGPVANVGMVIFYTAEGQTLGAVFGSTAEDRIGSGGVTAIASQGYVICSPLWDKNGVANAGAVTCWSVYGELAFAVSDSNSFVGASANDQLGSGGIKVVGDAGFVVSSPHWSNGAAADAGAVTFGSVLGGPAFGVVSASNSFVGASANDQVGSGGIMLLGDAGFVVSSPHWSNGAAVEAGAVTFGPAFGGPNFGVVSALNSFVGASANDQVGSGGITVVGDVGFVVSSPHWSNGAAADAGAVTFGPAFGGLSFGVVSALNSYVGASANDQVGSGGIRLIDDVGFVFSSPHWSNGTAADAGAVTFGPAFVGPSFGVVSALNSFVGASANDQVGSGGITLIDDVGFVVSSPHWSNGAAADAGAVTFVPAFVAPSFGVVSALNSFVGASANDQVGSGGITLVGDAGFVVSSPHWSNGAAADAGAVTLGGFYGPMWGVISESNSLVGSHANDQIGSGGITRVDNLSIVVRSPNWDNGAATDAGAVTLGGPFPMVGVVSESNSLVGSHANDQIGSGGVTLLGNGGFVVHSPQWDNGAAADAGAVTLGGLFGPMVGAVSESNSLVGSHANDQIGSRGIGVGSNSTVIVFSPLWDNGPAADAGAVTFVGFFGPPWGVLSASNSLVGSHPNDQIGSGGITAPFVLNSPNWCYGAGAVTNFTFGPIIGVVSAANSTVGAESAEPVIAVQQLDLTNIPSGGARDFGTVTAGNQSALSFVIKNNGTDDLLLNGISNVLVTGSDAPWFSVGAQPPSLLVAGDSATFTITFTAAGEGVRTAALAISSNDSTRSLYQIALSGTAQSQISSWRQTYFGSAANSGQGADASDYDHDGISNLLEFAFGLNPVQNNSGRLPVPNLAGGHFVYTFTEPSGLNGLTYGAEWSPSLTPGNWQPVTDTGTAPQHVFSVPIGTNTQMYMRLKVTAP